MLVPWGLIDKTDKIQRRIYAALVGGGGGGGGGVS